MVRTVPQASRLPSRMACILGLLFSLCTIPVFAQEVLLREVISREISIFNGQAVDHEISEVVSREISIFNGRALGHEMPEVISREISIVNTTDDPPARIDNLGISTSPTGEQVTLDWSAYNELAQNDVAYYAIYYSSNAFSDVSGMTAYTNIPAGQVALTLEGLPAWQDHFFAVIPVDAAGHYYSDITYSAAYVLGAELISREISIFNGLGDFSQPEVISREISIVVDAVGAPSPIANISISTSPTGDQATLDWSSYNELAENDVQRYDIYFLNHAFSDVSGMTPYTNVPAGQLLVMLAGLPAWQDHFFAVVPVDALDQYDVSVVYSAAYVLGGELISREISIFNGQAVAHEITEVISREITMVVADDTTPEPVTGVDSGFTAEMSVSKYGAIDLAWPNYNELAQNDVTGYRVYIGDEHFEDVSGMAPFAQMSADRKTYTLNGLQGLKIYYVAVVAVDSLGNFDPTVYSRSALSSINFVGEVQNLTVESGANSLSFSWQHPDYSDKFRAAYRIYFDGAIQPIILPATATSWSTNGLDRASGYLFKIRSEDHVGSVSGGVTVQAATWLYNPASTATAGDRKALVQWPSATPAGLVKEYRIYQSTAPFADVSGMEPVATVTESPATVGGLLNWQNYHFSVAAVNISDGQSPVVQSSAGIIPLPDTKSTLTASSTMGGHIDPEGEFEVDFGSSMTFNIITEPYWYLVDVLADGGRLGQVSSHTFSDVMEDGFIHAEFAPNMVTSGPIDIPEWWFAQYGWTNDFDAAVTKDPDGDGFVNWAEYIATSDPTNAASYFRIKSIWAQDGSLFLQWEPSASNRLYRILDSVGPTNLVNEVKTVIGPANAAEIPPSRPVGMLRMEVEMNEAPEHWVVMAFADTFGRITPAGLSYVTRGSNSMSFAIDASPWHHILDVTTNGASAGAIGELNLTNIVENMGVRAMFAANLVTNAPVDVPEYWLAEYGWSNDFESVVIDDADSDDFATWKEYVAGSEPDNDGSYLRITDSRMEDGAWVIEWEPSVPGRVYTPVLMDLAAGTNNPQPEIEGPINTATNAMDESSGFLRMKVKFKESEQE